MTKSHVLKFYKGCIDSAEKEVEALREKLDETLDYLGQMNRKKYDLESNKNTYK